MAAGDEQERGGGGDKEEQEERGHAEQEERGHAARRARRELLKQFWRGGERDGRLSSHEQRVCIFPIDAPSSPSPFTPTRPPSATGRRVLAVRRSSGEACHEIDR